MSVTSLGPETTAPTRFRIEAGFLGFAADSSVILSAASAIVALGAGSVDELTSVAVEVIGEGFGPAAAGGRGSLLIEVRSASGELAEAAVAEVIDCLHDAANRPECTSDMDISVQQTSGLAR